MAMPARSLAEFFDLPEHYLAKQMQKLSVAGVVETRRGPKGGYALARKPAEITLLQMVEAIDGVERHFRCTEIRRCGPSGVSDNKYIQPCGIARSMWRAEAAWRTELSNVTLADIQKMGFAETPPEQAIKAMTWMKDKLT
jgi:Rrf2 family protein